MKHNEEGSFLEVVGALFVATLIFRYCRRHLGMSVDDPAATLEERLVETLDAINAREMSAGRLPLFAVVQRRPAQ